MSDRRKASGAHYTPQRLAEFVAEKIVESVRPEPAGKGLVVADPAVGEGELLTALLRALPSDVVNTTSVHGFETDPHALAAAQERLSREFPLVHQKLKLADFLEYVAQEGTGDVVDASLFSSESTEKFDLVIANPPYVRTQVLGASLAQSLARKFGLTGRVDLYFPFLLGIAAQLKPGGVAGVIVSNRFMTTRAGAAVREALLKHFEVLHVWDLGDTKLFEAAVLPAVLLLRRAAAPNEISQSRFTSIYSAPDSADSKKVDDFFLALNEQGTVQVASAGHFNVQQGLLSADGVWRVQSEAGEELLSRVRERTHATFGEVGKIRVGVKTTADDVYLRNDWQELPAELQPELLRPLTTHHNARPFRPSVVTPPWQILYTHTMEQGRRVPVDLTQYPRAAAYLAQFKDKLQARRYVIEAGRKWYEIWVPQHPESWAGPKVVLRDIAAEPVFWLDTAGTIVNGDCYWIEPRSGLDQDVLWLILAVGNSSFSVTFYDALFNNRLYSSRRRFMTQYVEHFPLPDPKGTMGRSIIAGAREAYASDDDQLPRLKDELDALVWQAFGLTKEVGR